MATSIDGELLACLPHLRAFARSLTRDHCRADDLVQSAIVRALSAASQFEGGTNFKAWIFTILRNCYFGELRRDRAWVPLETVNLDRFATAPTQLAGGLELDDFNRALKTLRPKQRQALLLVGAEGYGYKKAAQICACPLGTLKSRIMRARRQIRRMIVEDNSSSPAISTVPAIVQPLGLPHWPQPGRFRVTSWSTA